MNRNNEMLISIITVCFNNVETIEETIRSVTNQTFLNIEYIIIDGNSTDGTKNVISKYKQQISTFISEPDKGMYDAINKGINLAKGDIIGLLHADDFYTSNQIIQKVATIFNEHPKTSLVYGNLEYVSKSNPNKIVRKWISGEYNFSLLKNGWMPPHPTLFVKKKLYEQCGLFNTSFSIAADYEMMMRLLCKHKEYATYLPEVLIKMRLGGKSNKSIRNIIRKSLDDYKVIKMHKVGNIFTLIKKNTSKIKQFLN